MPLPARGEEGAVPFQVDLVDISVDARTHYYGMVAESGFFMRGLASDIPQTPQPGTVASGPTGPG